MDIVGERLTWLRRVYQGLKGAEVVGVRAGIHCMEWVCEEKKKKPNSYSQPGSRYAYMHVCKVRQILPRSPVTSQW